MGEIECRVLGPFEVRRGLVAVSAGGGTRRALLAVLLLSAGRPVTVDRLIAALWGERPPRIARNLVQGYVADWRRMLEPDRTPRAPSERLVSTAGGYRVVVADGECDLLRFRALCEDGRRARGHGELDTAVRLLDRALAEWRGRALADFAGHPFHTAAVAELEEERLEAVEAAAESDLEFGQPDRALARIGDDVAGRPLRERLVELRMLALYRLGRQAEALASYEAARRALASELGVDPGAGLQRLHVAMLRQDESLHGPATSISRGIPRRLPVPLSTFVGRRRELREVRSLLDEHRLTTLTGPGGSGKTRLALQAAADVAGHDGGEVAFVDLAPVRAASRVVPAIADALDVSLAGDLEPARALATQLSGRRLLLVVDNFEHVLDAAADVTALLAAATQVAVLATSREPLGVAGEVVYVVGPLPLPRPGTAQPAQVHESDAVRLFVDRASTASPGLTVTDRDAAVLAAICRRLDGLPLALELAAPWVRTLSLRALLEQLDHALGLLTVGGGDRPERQRTLRAAIDWSYQALQPTPQTLLDRLSVFRSGARFDAVAAVADLDVGCLPALRSLVDKNLVDRTDGQDPRYRLLETVREYAAERLAARPDDELASRDRHSNHVCQLAEQAARASRSADGQQHVRRLGEEQDEIRSALDHLHDTGKHAAAMALAVDALALWYDLCHLREGFDHLRHALDVTVDADPALRAAATTAAANLATALAEQAEVLELADLAASIAGQAGDRCMQAAALSCLGDALIWVHPEQGRRTLERAIAIAASTAEPTSRWGWARPSAVIAGATCSLAESLRFRDRDRARRVLHDGLTMTEQAGDRHTSAFLERILGLLAVDRGDWSAAETWLAASLEGARQSGSQRSEGRSHEALAELAWARGDLDMAETHARRAVQLSRDAGHLYNWARSALRLGEVMIARDRVDDADVAITEVTEPLAACDPVAAATLLGPARARVARLRGSIEPAAAHLAAAAEVQPADELRPQRIMFLLESAELASLSCDDATGAAHIRDLDRRARDIGFVLAVPDRERRDDLLRRLGVRHVDPPR